MWMYLYKFQGSWKPNTQWIVSPTCQTVLLESNAIVIKYWWVWTYVVSFQVIILSNSLVQVKMLSSACHLIILETSSSATGEEHQLKRPKEQRDAAVLWVLSMIHSLALQRSTEQSTQLTSPRWPVGQQTEWLAVGRRHHNSYPHCKHAGREWKRERERERERANTTPKLPTPQNLWWPHHQVTGTDHDSCCRHLFRHCSACIVMYKVPIVHIVCTSCLSGQSRLTMSLLCYQWCPYNYMLHCFDIRKSFPISATQLLCKIPQYCVCNVSHVTKQNSHYFCVVYCGTQNITQI